MFTRILAAGTVALAATAALATTAAGEPIAPGIEISSAGVVLSGFEPGGFTRAPDGSIRITTAGAVVPGTFTLDGVTHRLDARIDDAGRTLTLTPEIAAHPVASAFENQLALNDFATLMSRSPVVGTIVGGVVGALIGTLVGASTCLVVGPACIATIPAAIVAFAGAGGVAGTALIGGGTLAVGLWNYLTVLQAPPGQSSYAGHGDLVDPNGTGVPDAQLQLPSGSSNGLKAGSSSGSGN